MIAPNEIVIYDDDQNACKQLISLLRNFYSPNTTKIYGATKAAEALGRIGQQTDVIFIDIELEEHTSGITFAQMVRKNFPEINIVFITAHIKYCETIFSVSPVGFLVKPFRTEQIGMCLRNLKQPNRHKDFLTYTPTASQVIKLPLSDITYIEIRSRKCLCHNAAGEVIASIPQKLDWLEEQFPPYIVRCHYSFAVNLHYVTSIKRYSISLETGEQLPCSQSHYKAIRESFLHYLGELT